MKIITTVGARPNFVKVAPILAEIRRHNERVSASAADRRERPTETIEHVLVHTGQHYGDLMSGSFFRDLRLPVPDVHLGVGSGSHAVQTAEIMKKFEEVLLGEKPDVVVVVGDVNSTLACALVAAKIAFDPAGSRPLIAHVEAGLRSFDGSMPEEVNRILTDHVSDLLFVTEESALRNLDSEGIPRDRIHFVGNTMIDALLAFQERAEASTILEALGLRRRTTNNGGGNSTDRYALLTLHRPTNVDSRDAFLNIVAGLEELARDCPIVFPAHPRTQARIQGFGLGPYLHRGIALTDPLGYLDFLCLLKHATLVVTDSGGIQEETTCLGIPCVTVRKNTERPVTVERGTNTVAGTDRESIKDAIRRQMGRKASGGVPEKWDGRAASRIVDVLIDAYRKRACSRESSDPATTESRAGHSTYVLITPARNEAEFIERTINAVVLQTVRPAKWVIVSDGSTDGTDEVVKRYTAQHGWIELVRHAERVDRHFAGKAGAFDAGYARVKELEYEVIGNLDADISFDEDYFAFLMRKFRENPRLGVAGTPYREGNATTYDYRFASIEDVAGACQMFRRECFEAIGGYWPIKSGGIDLIAVLSARAKGWQTRTFTEKVCLHHRKSGSAQHVGLSARLHKGQKDYLLGSHPAWELLGSVHQMKNRPYIVGGVLTLVGYFWTMLRRAERTMPADLIELRRNDQMRRLRAIFRRTALLRSPVVSI